MKDKLNIPFISVCVPSYKNPAYLQRLLNSLMIQGLRDFEVIITDDSPDQSVQNLINFYSEKLTIRYFKNLPPLGTPENWNQAIRQAKGQWIKLIHDDDWLSSETSLQEYVNAINQNPGIDFFFSAYYNVEVETGNEDAKSESNTEMQNHNFISGFLNSNPVIKKPSRFRIRQLKQNCVTLLSKNIIGPPSVVLHRNDQKYFYDKNLKWLVDMDFYMRYLENRDLAYIDKPLVNIGLNEQQVTKSSSMVREVEIPEHFRILEKTGIQNLKNLLVYDAWWRLMRNLKIRDIDEIKIAGYEGNIPEAIINLIKFQRKVPFSLLKFGPASKSLMIASYTHNTLTNSFRN
jgi:glycosyltransferase involved in cell wall biosynthesis